MPDFHKNDLIDETLERYYETFKCTLDTLDFVPAKTNTYILKYIDKNLRKTFRRVNKEERMYQKEIKSAEKEERKAEKEEERSVRRAAKKEAQAERRAEKRRKKEERERARKAKRGKPVTGTAGGEEPLSAEAKLKKIFGKRQKNREA